MCLCMCVWTRRWKTWKKYSSLVWFAVETLNKFTEFNLIFKSDVQFNFRIKSVCDDSGYSARVRGWVNFPIERFSSSLIATRLWSVSPHLIYDWAIEYRIDRCTSQKTKHIHWQEQNERVTNSLSSSSNEMCTLDRGFFFFSFFTKIGSSFYLFANCKCRRIDRLVWMVFISKFA